jgi:regulator of protease activity HflC (stomatin/prohibitin superfamily)
MKLTKKLLTALSILAIAPVATGCMSIVEDGEVGLRQKWGRVDPQELKTGGHTTFTSDILVFSTRENIFTVQDLNPQTKNNTIMKDFDVDVNYSVDPSSVAELYTRYSKSYHRRNDQGEIYPMVGFLERFVNTAVNKAVRKYEALDVNTSRSMIEQDILAQLNDVLRSQGLFGKVKINSVTVTGVQLPDNLVASVNRQVAARAEREAKSIEVETARLESQRISLLSGQASQAYTDQIRAQADLNRSEALKTAAAKGGLSVWVTPEKFTSVGPVK